MGDRSIWGGGGAHLIVAETDRVSVKFEAIGFHLVS